MFEKFEQMNATMANMQQQMQNSNKGKVKVVNDEESIMGLPLQTLEMTRR